jgi:hypothetical protein
VSAEWRQRAIDAEAQVRLLAASAERWDRLADSGGPLDVRDLPPRWREVVDGLQRRALVAAQEQADGLAVLEALAQWEAGR